MTATDLEVVCTLCAEKRPRAECISGNEHFACIECVGLAVGFFVEQRGPSFLATHFFDAGKQLTETRSVERARTALRLAIASTDAADLGFLSKVANAATQLGDAETAELAIARVPLASRSHALRVQHAAALIDRGRRDEAAAELAPERLIGASSSDELGARLMRYRLALTPGCSVEVARTVVDSLSALGGLFGALPELELQRRLVLTDALLASGERDDAMRAANAAMVLAPNDPRAAQAWTRARTY